MNLRVNLTKRVKTAEGLRYCPAVVSGNGRIKPDWVVVDSTEERHPEGSYYIDWTESGGKRRRVSVGTDATVAHNRRLRKEAELNAVANGVAVVPDETESKGRDLTTAIVDFVATPYAA